MVFVKSIFDNAGQSTHLILQTLNSLVLFFSSHIMKLDPLPMSSQKSRMCQKYQYFNQQVYRPNASFLHCFVLHLGQVFRCLLM
ncbi:hypothetical protein E2C01_090118 [Portunus trituberculatus]|uniref:Uncharacterized protein n=1 Tax=Portunus trituberculatus TaxID=210409 RepID=A0A5B7JP86_PORTR|nr:hypothetical protein [Portunus trituberculatus]